MQIPTRNLEKEEATGITVFHGTQNKTFVQEALDEAGIQNDNTFVTLQQLPCANLTVPEYSQLLTTADFWRQFEDDAHILVFQTDSILSETSPYRWQDFADYAYVGAPWRHLPRFQVGNGGLSLRSRDAMIEACQCMAQDPIFRRYGQHTPEDLKLACYFQPRARRQYRLPARDVSCRFSVESIYAPRPLGIHKAWARLSVREWQALKKQDAWFAEIECWQHFPQNSIFRHPRQCRKGPN